MEITYTAGAYMNPRWHRIESIVIGKDTPTLSSSDPKYMRKEGYVLIGEATVTVRLLPADERTRRELEALNAQLQAMRAEHHRAQQAILDRISKLQALPMAGVVESA